MERFDLDPTKKARSYSKGNRQKVALIAALSVEAELLLLDEPTSGLDPLMERTFQQVIRELAGDGRAILLSSHILSEVEALCERVTIIRAGRQVVSGALSDLRQLTRVSVTARLAGSPRELADRLASAHDLTVRDDEVSFQVDRADLNATLTALTAHGVLDLTTRPPTLEELFTRHYETAGQAS